MGWRIIHPLECPVAFHGTFQRFVQGILREGLIPGGHKHNARSETFFSCPEPTGVVSSGSWDLCSKLPGYKFNCEIVVVVDVYRACKAGAVLYLSDGNALLTRHVLDPEYILFVCNARTGRDIWLNRVRGGVPPENRCRFYRAVQVELKYGLRLHLNFDAFDEEDTRRAKEEIPFINRVVPTL